jgi:hypothetical protein
MSRTTAQPFIEGTAGLRAHVERFLVDAEELPRLTPAQRIDLIEEVVAFLVEILLPHTRAQEHVVFAEVDRVSGSRGSGAVAVRDRALIRARVQELADAEPGDVGHIQQILYALYLVASGVFRKEEEAFLRLARDEPPDEVELVLERMDSYERAFTP